MSEEMSDRRARDPQPADAEREADEAARPAGAGEPSAAGPGAAEGSARHGAVDESAQPGAAEEPGAETLEQLREEATAHWEKYLRVVAELENLRKRSARELENARKFGVERFAGDILPVRDSIEAALTSSDKVDVETLLEGERATLRLLDQALEAAGIREIDPLGEPFDPTKHEAVAMLESDRAEPSSVLEVVQKGFEIHDRIMRPARVVVAKAPGAEEA